MNTFSLWKRFLASILDKVSILILFIFGLLFIVYTPYLAPDRLGVYSYQLTVPPSNYEYIDLGKFQHNAAESSNYEVSEHFEMKQAMVAPSIEPKSLEIDLTITIWFIVVNVLYYIIGELFVGASFFKRLLGGKLVNLDYKPITKSEAITRGFLFAAILSAFVALRFILDVNYIFIIVAYFILFDYSVFTKKKSLLDKLSRSLLVPINLEIENNELKETFVISKNDDATPKNRNYDSNEFNSIKHNDIFNKVVTKSEASFIEYETKIIDKKEILIKKDKTPSKKNKFKKHVFIPSSFVKDKCILGLSVLLFVICVMCYHNISKYFLADYYNLSNYYLYSNSYTSIPPENWWRKSIINTFTIPYQDENLLASINLGEKTISNLWLNADLGTVPPGRLISTYTNSYQNNYFAGYEAEMSYESIQALNEYMLKIGIKDSYQDQWRYTERKPVYKSYTWWYAISTFNISDYMSPFENEDFCYSKYLYAIEKELSANYHCKYIYTTIDKNKALAYYTIDEVPLKRVIFCANKKAYLIETKSIRDIDNNSDSICSTFTASGYAKSKEGKLGLITNFFILSLCLTLFFILNIARLRKYKTKNRVASKLFQWSIFGTFANIITAAIQAYMFYTDFDVTASSALLLVVALSTAIFLCIPIFIFFLRRSKIEYSLEFILPNFLQKNTFDKIKKDINRKIFISFVGYPLLVISTIPLGIYTLLYSIPAALLSFFAIWITKWSDWVGESKLETKKNIPFKNYYAILGIPNNASKIDIDIAFNRKIAELNQFVYTKDFNKPLFNCLQEAYKVIGCDPIIKAKYDAELVNYERCPLPSDFQITDLELKDYIDKLMT